MAHLVRPRIVPCINSPSTWQQPVRHFSASQGHQARKNGRRPTREQTEADMLRNQIPQRSNIARHREVLQYGLLSDLGMLQGTLIMPTGSALPGWTQSPIARLRLERKRLWHRTKDFLSVLTASRMTKPAMKLQLRQIASIGMKMHKEMYRAFAANDQSQLRDLCNSGLFDSLRARIQERDRRKSVKEDIDVHWTLQSYSAKPRVVSHRATKLPLPFQSQDEMLCIVRQAVVRIASRQSLEIVNQESRQLVQGTGAAKDIVEYVVLQKMFFQGEEQDWKLWGFTDETKMEDLDKTLNPSMPPAKVDAV